MAGIFPGGLEILSVKITNPGGDGNVRDFNRFIIRRADERAGRF